MLALSVFGLESSRSLLLRAQKDANAFAAFYETYADGVFRFVVGRLLDAETALDVTSETFAVALERRLQFRGRTAAEEQAWLYAIARNELNHFWRRGKVERHALNRIGVEVPALDDAELERLEQRASVQAVVAQLGFALRQLPRDQRDAVEQRVLKEHTYEEIAHAQGVSQQLVRARVSRGLRSLATSLRHQGVLAEDVV